MTTRRLAHVSELIRRACLRRYNEPMLIDPANGRTVNGAELIAEVDVASRSLNAMGVRTGETVGIHLPTGVDLVVSFLAVWELGAAYVALDQLLPEARLNMLIDDTAARVVISNRVSPPIATHGKTTIVHPDDWKRGTTGPNSVGAGDNSEAGDNSDPENCAYVVYTSGSTGRPKGVRATHGNLRAFLDSWDRVVDPTHPGLWLATTSFAFDPSVVELVWTLSRGATVVLAPAAGLTHSIGELIELHGVTHFQCTPTRAKVLVDDPFEAKGLGLLTHLLIGGETLASSLVARLYSTGLARITNVYGPTETTVWAFAHEVHRGAVDPIPVGQPLPGVLTRIAPTDELSRNGHAIGELHIGGASVSPGYLHFHNGVDAPFSVEDGSRWYRTGDMVSQNADGLYEFYGRRDAQVKVNGVRIELGEVESAFESDSLVSQAVAGLVRDELGRPELACWLIANDGPLDIVELRRRVRTVLPAGLIPSVIAEVDAFPLTPTGKADRLRLAATTKIQPVTGEQPFSPGSSNDNRTYDAEDARRHFATCLDTAIVGPDSDFFELGGDSLGAAQLATIVHRDTGLSIALRSIIEAPTPTTFAHYIASLQSNSALSNPAVKKVLVRFGPRRNLPQIYIVHGDGGNVLGFRDLALRIADHADLVGIQALGVEPDHEPDPDLPTMVARYLEAVRADRAKADDDSTLLLGGYSGGGKIAVAMGAAWANANVGPVALLDASVSEQLAPTKVGRTRAVVASALRRGPQSLPQWAQMSARAWTVRFEARSKEIEPRFAYVESVVSAATAAAPPGTRLPNGAFVVRVLERNPVFTIDYDWGSVLKTDVEEHWIPGHHLTMFLPQHVAALCEALLAGFGRFLR